MPILELPISVFGRRLRPVALGLTIWSIAVFWAASVELDHIWDMGVLIASAVCAALLVLAWVFNSQRLEEAGLLLVVFAACVNAANILMTVGLSPRPLVSLGIMVIAGGSYWLERLLPRDSRIQVGGD